MPRKVSLAPKACWTDSGPTPHHPRRHKRVPSAAENQCLCAQTPLMNTKWIYSGGAATRKSTHTERCESSSPTCIICTQLLCQLSAQMSDCPRLYPAACHCQVHQGGSLCSRGPPPHHSKHSTALFSLGCLQFLTPLCLFVTRKYNTSKFIQHRVH